MAQNYLETNLRIYLTGLFNCASSNASEAGRRPTTVGSERASSKQLPRCVKRIENRLTSPDVLLSLREECEVHWTAVALIELQWMRCRQTFRGAHNNIDRHKRTKIWSYHHESFARDQTVFRIYSA